jgi:hypothetical protein
MPPKFPEVLATDDDVGDCGNTNSNIILSPQTTEATTANNFQPDLELEAQLCKWQEWLHSNGKVCNTTINFFPTNRWTTRQHQPNTYWNDPKKKNKKYITHFQIVKAVQWKLHGQLDTRKSTVLSAKMTINATPSPFSELLLLPVMIILPIQIPTLNLR